MKFEKRKYKKSTNPARIIFFSFLMVILVGSFLLKLPISNTTGNIKYIDALYTSTSAVCVTGLIVKDTAKDFTRFGQIVILTLIQIGGLGIMTFSLMFILLFSKKLTVKDTVLASAITGQTRLENIGEVLRYVILFTFGTEVIGFLLLLVRFIKLFPLKTAIFYSLFHSVSAFCNAGFSTFSDSLQGFRNDVWVNFVIIGLIIVGGIGFIVALDVQNYFKFRKTKKKHRLTLHSKLTIITTGLLVVIGTILVLYFENSHQLNGMNLSDKILCSFFQSVTCRTAGFNSLDITKLSSSTLLVSMVLMFIGGSPSSTAGGIKTTTFAVLFLTLVAMIKDKNDVEVYHKSMAKTLVNKTVAIVTISFFVVVAITIIAMHIESDYHGSEKFIKYLFETVSALGTVGLSMDTTVTLSFSSKILYIATMFLGRLGPLTFALALTSKERKINYKYPEGKVLIG